MNLSVIRGPRDEPAEAEVALLHLAHVWRKRVSTTRPIPYEDALAARNVYRWLHGEWMAAKAEGRRHVAIR